MDNLKHNNYSKDKKSKHNKSMETFTGTKYKNYPNGNV